MDEPSRDEALMAEVARGKRAALEPLVRRYATALLTFIRRMTGDHHRGEELFQEVFLAVWRNRRQYEPRRPFKPWLYAIALNQCRAAFRRAPPIALPLEHETVSLAVDADPSPVDTAIATETAVLVASAVALLPPQQRAVVVLRVWQQMPYADIAQVLETEEATVRSYMHHALCALRRRLEPRLATRE
ncbi:MAG: sigma-70 family RNA polymerase sigma factor [Planctomycetes bacterium]|nr:sigma-70 family RNA polymerase sigma factor [Planctomycetota bacterium]